MCCNNIVSVHACSICISAQVEALRDKLASLQSDLKANSAHNKQLQQKLLEVKRSHSSREKELLDENEQLSAQVSKYMQLMPIKWYCSFCLSATTQLHV